MSSTSFSNNGHPLFPLYLSSLQSRVFLSIEGRVISPHFLPRENRPTDDYIHGAVSIPPPKNFGRRRQRRRRTQQFPRCCCCSLTIPFLIFLPFHFRLFPCLALFGENNSLPPAKKGKHRIIKLRVDVTSQRIRRKRKQIWWNFRAKRIWRILTNVTWNEPNVKKRKSYAIGTREISFKHCGSVDLPRGEEKLRKRRNNYQSRHKRNGSSSF